MALRDNELTTTLDFDFSDNSGVSTVASPYIADTDQQVFEVGLNGIGDVDGILRTGVTMTQVMAGATAGTFQIGVYQDTTEAMSTPTLLALSPTIALPADGDIVDGPVIPKNTEGFIAVVPVWAGTATTGECSATIFMSDRLVNDGAARPAY